MLIPNQLCQVEIRLLFSCAADEVEILYMRIKFDDLIEHVNNLMKNMLWGLIRRWIYIHHCMAAGAKLTKKKKKLCERWERSTFNVCTSHIRWRNCYGSKCTWWTGWCAVMSYLAAVACYGCSHLLQVRSTSDRPTLAQANPDTLSSGQKPSEALHSHNDVSSPPSDKTHSSDIQKKIWLTPFSSNEQQIVLSNRFFLVNWMNQFTESDWTV